MGTIVDPPVKPVQVNEADQKGDEPVHDQSETQGRHWSQHDRSQVLVAIHQRRSTSAYLVDGHGTTVALSKRFGLPRKAVDQAAANAATRRS